MRPRPLRGAKPGSFPRRDGLNTFPVREGLVARRAWKPVFSLVAASNSGSARRQAAVTASRSSRAGMSGNFDEDQAPKGEPHRRCWSETRPARPSREQAVERATKPCGRKVPGRQRPGGPDLDCRMCQRGRKSRGGAVSLRASGWPRPCNALKGRGTRGEVRGRILNHPPATVGWEDQTAGPKGQRRTGIAEPMTAIPADRTEL